MLENITPKTVSHGNNSAEQTCPAVRMKGLSDWGVGNISICSTGVNT
ncbi:uncharacterized protein METZ01_LOCUS318810, partial [marine metagenome]